MKATLKLNGKEYEVEVSEEMAKDLEKPKKTGYERAKTGSSYFIDCGNKLIEPYIEQGDPTDDTFYDIANYYSDKTVAQNNGRADTLMRKLRRFAVEHREYDLDWNDMCKEKYCIAYDHETKRLVDAFNQIYQAFGKIYFDTQETAKLAIEEFKDELIWYFTEYRDSL